MQNIVALQHRKKRLTGQDALACAQAAMLNKYYEVFSKHLKAVFFSGRGKKIKTKQYLGQITAQKAIAIIYPRLSVRKKEQQMQLFNVTIPTQIKYIQLIGSLPSTF